MAEYVETLRLVVDTSDLDRALSDVQRKVGQTQRVTDTSSKAMSQSMANVTTSTSAVGKAMGGLGSAATTAGGVVSAATRVMSSALGGVSAAASGVGRAISGIGSMASGVGKTLGGAFSAVGTAATVAVGAVTATGIGLAKTGLGYIDLWQRSTASWTTLLGSAEKARGMMEDIAGFSSKMPFGRATWIQATQQLLGFGVEAEKVIPMLQGIGDAVAATGGGAQDVQDVARILANVSSSGKITGETLMQLGVRGINAAQIIGDEFGKTGEQVQTAITSGTLKGDKAIDALTRGMTKKYAGAGAGVTKTFSGMVGAMQSRLRDLGTAIVEPFISREGGGYIIEWGTRVTSIINGFTKVFGPVWQSIVDKWKPALDGFTTALDGINDKIKTFDVKAFVDQVGRLSKFLAPVGAALLAIGTSNIGGLLGPFGALLPKINPVLAAVATLLVSIPQVRKFLEQTVGVVLDLGKAFFTAFTSDAGALGIVGDLVEKVFGPGAAAMIRPLLQRLMDFLGAIKEGGGWLAFFQKKWAELQPTVMRVANTLKTAFGGVMDIVKKLTSGDLTGGLFGGMKDSPVIGMLARLKDVAMGLGPAFKEFATNILPILLRLLSRLGPIVVTVAGALAEFAMNVVPVLMRVFARLWPIIETVGDTLGRLAQEVLPPLLAIVGRAVEIVGGFAENALGLIQQYILPLIPLVLDFVNKALIPLVSKLVEAAGVIGGILLKELGQLLRFISPLLPPIFALAQALGKLAGVIADILLRVLQELARMWERILPTLERLQPIFDALGQVIGVVAEAVSGLADVIAVQSDAADVGFDWVDAVVWTLEKLVDVILLVFNVIGFLVDRFKDLWTATEPIRTLLAEELGREFGIIGEYIQTFIANIQSIAEKVDWVWTEIRTRWEAAGGDMQTFLLQLGSDLMQALLNGIANFMLGVAVWIKANVVDPLLASIKDPLKIGSPSGVLEQVGVDIMQGLLNGIASKSEDLKKLMGGVAGTVGGAFDNLGTNVSGALSGAASAAPASGEIADYIRSAAAQRGIDPEIAVRVAQSEGGVEEAAKRGTFNTGSSWWPFQLHYGGAGTPYESLGTVAGMGNNFTAQTGYQPGDPTAWKASTDYALDQAAKSGWGQWYGAAAAGIGNYQGIPSADEGGWLMPGINTLANNTGTPERILAPGTSGGITVNLGGLTINAPGGDGASLGEALPGIAEELANYLADRLGSSLHNMARA